MSNMKYPSVEHVRHINPTKADLSERIFIVGYPPAELKGKRKKKFCRVCRENCQSYRHPQQITWQVNSFGVLISAPIF